MTQIAKKKMSYSWYLPRLSQRHGNNLKDGIRSYFRFRISNPKQVTFSLKKGLLTVSVPKGATFYEELFDAVGHYVNGFARATYDYDPINNH